MFMDLLKKRRSIRQFKNQPIEKEKLDILLEAGLRSPSSRSIYPWEFVVITEPEKITQLSRAKPHGSEFLKKAPLLIVVCADPEKSDVWVEDTAIASLLLHLTAADLGLGSCWVQIRLREHSPQLSAQEYVAEVIGLKKGMVVESIIGIGYSTESKPGHHKSSLAYNKLHFEHYSQKN